jgi:protein-S-isoprenylcysteine O-methyltransferase Ste14
MDMRSFLPSPIPGKCNTENTVSKNIKIGQGTPAPMMPTRRLLVTGPYHLCRNPMVLGTIIAYLGVVVLTGSLSSFRLAASQ